MIELYKEYRKQLVNLHSKILKTINRVDFNFSVRHFRPKDKQFNIQSQAELDYIKDFNLYEKIHGETTVIEQYYLNNKNLCSKLELDLLKGMMNASTSLYIITKIDKNEKKLHLEDLLNIGQSIEIIDINFSQTCQINMLLFTRIIKLDFLNLTSGFSMLFNYKYMDSLICLYKKQSILESDEIHRFINFFYQNRKVGNKISFS